MQLSSLWTMYNYWFQCNEISDDVAILDLNNHSEPTGSPDANLLRSIWHANLSWSFRLQWRNISALCVPWTHALNGWELKATCSNPIQFSGLQGTPHKLHFFSARDLTHAEGHSACSNAVQSLARPSQAKLQELGTTSNSVHGIINCAELKGKRKIPE